VIDPADLAIRGHKALNDLFLTAIHDFNKTAPKDRILMMANGEAVNNSVNLEASRLTSPEARPF
jgi:hypothetical protein